MIVITGLGRSGTSFTAKVLCETGVSFKGDWYDEKIKAGMEYNKVAEINNLLIQGSVSSVDEAVSQLGWLGLKEELAGDTIVKDPRFMMTFDLWVSSGFDISHIVYCWRDHSEIYQSAMASGCGLVGDMNNGVMIPTLKGSNIFLAYVERTFLSEARKREVPVTRINFPDSAKVFSEVEKLSFLTDKEKLRVAWEKCRKPQIIASDAAKPVKDDDKNRLVDALTRLNIKDQEVLKLNLRVEQLNKKLAELSQPIPKMLERRLRKKIHSARDGINNFYARNFYPKLLGNSIPKSGTHLLSEVIINMGFRNKNTESGGFDNLTEFDEIELKVNGLKKGQYLYGHMHYSEDFDKILKKNDVLQILIVRDPRDVAASKAFYIPRRPEHRLSSYFNGLSQRERFIASIRGVPGSMPGVAEFFERYLPWLGDKKCLLIRFEDIVGSRGGGNDERQIETLKRISEHLEISFNDRQLKKIAEKSFNKNSATFRKGQIGDWVNWLDEESLDLLKKDEETFKKYGYSF